MAKKEVFSKSKLQEFRIGILEILKSVKDKGIALTKDVEEYTTKIITVVTSIIEKYIELGLYLRFDENEVISEVYETLLNTLRSINFDGENEKNVEMMLEERLKIFIFFGDKTLEGLEENQNLIIRYIDTFTTLFEKNGRIPTAAEIAFVLEEDNSKIAEIHANYIEINNIINFGRIQLDNKEYFAASEKKQKNINYSLYNFLKSNLLPRELYIILLSYGIETPNNPVVFDNKIIYFDGECKSQDEIGVIFSLKGERIRQIRHSALCKLAASNEILSYELYAQNPDLVLRLHDIYNQIKIIPFTDKYPNFYSYFPEYSKEEVQEILLSLEKGKINFLKTIIEFENKVSKFYYGIEQVVILFEIIRKVYGELIVKNGRRIMKTELSSPCVSMYGRNLNKIRSFYHSFDESDKKIVIYIVSKLTEARRQSLKQIYGSNLDKVHTPNEIVKIDRRVISALNDLFRIINTKLNKIKINGIPKEELNTVENKSSRLNGIYQFFSFISVEMVDASLNNLFNEELCILKKVFGDKLTDNNYYDNKEKLSEIELAIYNSIMNKLQKQLMFQKQSNKKNAKAAFYQFFYNLGYTKESVELVLSCNNIKSLVAEYLNQEVSFARKEKILEIIYKVLCKEFGQPFNYSRFKERVKQVQSPS